MIDEKKLEILHDHYKETFAHVRERERSRDRLFIWVIVLYALLAVEIGYPAEFSGSMGTLRILGGDLDLSALPLPALLSATWVMTLAIALRYCQTSIWITRQYGYVHYLEDVISPAVGGGDRYRREGNVYLKDYPLALDMTFVAYVLVFPLIVVLATLGLTYWECARLDYSPVHRLFDITIAVSLIAVFLIYRVIPYVQKWWKSRGQSEHICS